MKFKYVGEKKEMVGVYGYDFSDHREVEIEGDELAIRKLSANSHFKIIDEPVDEPVDYITPEKKTSKPKKRK